MNGVTAVNLGITTRCNFTCGFCWGRELPQDDLPMELFETVLDRFPQARYLDLTGEGEPWLHPRLLEMAARARARGLRLGLYTNGSLLDRADIDALLDLGLETLTVSLESADPKRFAQIRGGRLEGVRTGLARLMARRRERGLDRPTVQLAVTLLRDELADFEAIVALYRDLRLDGGIVGQSLNRMPGYARWYSPELAAQMLSEEEERQALSHIATLPESRKVGPGRSFFDELHDGFDSGSRACPWLERGIFIRHDGWVSPCCQIKETSLSYGQIGRDSWEHMEEARAQMRRQLAAGVVPQACLGCDTARLAVLQPPESGGRAHRAALQNEIGGLQREAADLAARAAAARSAADALRSSWSWRLAGVLRAAHRAARAVRLF